MIALRQATLDDIAMLWELRTRAIGHSCPGHYTPQVLAVWLASPAPASLERHIEHGGGLVAVDDGGIVAYAVLDPLSGEVEAAFVDPLQQGRGIGQMLLDALEANARAAGIERLFLSASLNAVPFYERAGFVALREELYPQPFRHRHSVGVHGESHRLSLTYRPPKGRRVGGYTLPDARLRLHRRPRVQAAYDLSRRLNGWLNAWAAPKQRRCPTLGIAAHPTGLRISFDRIE